MTWGCYSSFALWRFHSLHVLRSLVRILELFGLPFSDHARQNRCAAVAATPRVHGCVRCCHVHSHCFCVCGERDFRRARPGRRTPPARRRPRPRRPRRRCCLVFRSGFDWSCVMATTSRRDVTRPPRAFTAPFIWFLFRFIPVHSRFSFILVHCSSL